MSATKDATFGQGLEIAKIIINAVASAAKKTNADLDRIQQIVGQPGVIYDLVEGLLSVPAKASPSILQLISGGENLMIEAQDGKAYIAEAKNTFKGYIDGDFENWKLNKAGLATPETQIDVQEMTGDGKFVQIFTAITADLDKIVMSQNQIIRFCEKYPTWLRQEGYSTIFLIKENGEYFVVRVDVSPDGLGVSVSRLEFDDVLSGGYRRRVVSPQLIPLAA
jgi:hypothetical protein